MRQRPRGILSKRSRSSASVPLSCALATPDAKKRLCLLRNMGWTAVNDQENTVLGANHQPPKKLDENLGVDAAFFPDHEPHMAARSHRRDETHAVPRPGTQDNRCLALLDPGPAGMMIRAHMRGVAEIDVGFFP